MPKITPLLVDAHDLANLRESGLSDLTIRRNGLRTQGEALIFPYRNLDGTVNGFCRERPHNPPVIKGKVAKYTQPKGSPLRAYFPQESLCKLRDEATPIFITEGEKKSLNLAQAGHTAIGLGGVDSWGKDGKLIDDLAAVPWCGRTVYFAYDFDEKEATRQNVNSAMRRLARALRNAGAGELLRVTLPPGRDGGKQGVDDFLVTEGAEAFAVLVGQAQPVELENGNTGIKIIKTASPVLGQSAYYGFVGEFLRAIAPHTEATDAGVLAHLLPALGTICGKRYYVWAGSRQSARINTIVVGRTNAGRKGTSFAPVDILMELVNPQFWHRQRVNGLSSGEGLIAFVADYEEKDEEGNKSTVSVEKRVLVVEEEFSRVLAAMKREGNILSQTIRSAFDNGNLATLTVNPRHATGAHISIVGHITPEELRDKLETVEMANGFGNRFLWFLVESSKLLPHTRPFPDDLFAPFVGWIRRWYQEGTSRESVAMNLTKAAEARWESLYAELREDLPGLDGAMVARGSSMVLRIALIYAIFDKKPKPRLIDVPHLEAALAVWNYCRESAQALFHSENVFSN